MIPTSSLSSSVVMISITCSITFLVGSLRASFIVASSLALCSASSVFAIFCSFLSSSKSPGSSLSFPDFGSGEAAARAWSLPLSETLDQPGGGSALVLDVFSGEPGQVLLRHLHHLLLGTALPAVEDEDGR